VVAALFVVVHLLVASASTFLDHHRILGTIPGFVSVCPPYVLAVAVMLPALIAPGVPQWLLSRRPMVFLGERSYSIYLVQTIAQGAVLAVLPVAQGTGWQGFPVAVLAIVLAHFCYLWVEKPMIKRGQLVINRRKAAAAAVAAEPVELAAKSAE
jgi:peptidoglycan/LPS O-acetylase OafA/YrhL